MLTVAGLAALAVTGVPAAEAAPAKSGLELIAASSEVTLTQYKDWPRSDLDLGVYLGATGTPFEIRAQRKSYKDPITASRVVRTGGKTRTEPLPAGLVKNFGGFSRFLHVTLTDAKGKKVVDRYQDVCPSASPARVKPGAPDKSPYPDGCSDNPWTLGSVWGVQNGWATAITGYNQANPQVKLADGTYTATVSVTAPYQRQFGISATAKKIKVKVRTVTDDEGRPRASGTPTLKAGPKPSGGGAVPNGPKPDLRALPAWNIEVNHDAEEHGTAATRPDYLAFAANVWNAGPSPLVVDGFRVKQGLMDAYQYFFDGNGRQVGYARTGGMEWDARHGHEHWHFKDFASYRLLGADKKEVVRSQKEAFCLANTDAINQLVRNANWKPENTDLHTACGDLSSLSVREVLDVGSGDTYVQDLPGQSFDISHLKNGTYYIQVIANPAHRLFEGNLNNNVSLRKVILGGTPGKRTVKVPPVGLVNAP
ncbi:Lysyl oxidase [Actinomadura rubteroloni]|uniref:Lysyl oxidase n=1 Tax=Actinomadura rubteroloni TaxID=1926885 RepID=A0A2P4UMR0_9ACTN|nr:lysyl oxidase family protein [Actinomadura rubteroloni]POM26340.1 Lysyl oxidase [Actinomadura rubteroloni]